MPCANGAPSSQTIGDSRALGNQGASSSLGTWLCIWEHLSHTPSTPTMPWCAWMPGPASALALCCWGHLAGTTSAASWPGASRCLWQSRLMLVMMGALVLHTIGTSRALVREDASTSIVSRPDPERVDTWQPPRALEWVLVYRETIQGLARHLTS